MIRTRLTDLLDCERPVMLAGMGGVSHAALPGGMEEQVDAIIAGGASVFVAGLGVPSRLSSLRSPAAR